MVRPARRGEPGPGPVAITGGGGGDGPGVMAAAKAGRLWGERPRGLIGVIPLKGGFYVKQNSRPDSGLPSLVP